METRGYFSSIHADAKQGTLSTQAVGKMMQVGEESSMHGDRMAKAMNRDSERDSETENRESKRPRETVNNKP